MTDLSSVVNSPEHKIFHVKFLKGGKTKLHYHTGDQLLIVTKGRGRLEFFKRVSVGKSKFQIKPIQNTNLKEGDIVHIPPKTLHTHGSISKKQIFSHIAINSYPSKNQEPKTIWYESDFKRFVTKII